MENNAQLLKGILEYCVLKLIEKEPTYGYEIVIQLKQLGFSELSESTLYPMLLRLEQQEKVTWNGGLLPKDQAENIMWLREKGRQSLLIFKKNWNQLCQLVENIFKEE